MSLVIYESILESVSIPTVWPTAWKMFTIFFWLCSLMKSQTKVHVLWCQFSTFRGSVDYLEQCYIFLLSMNYLVLLIQGYSPHQTKHSRKGRDYFGITSETWSMSIPRQLVSWPGESLRSARNWRAVGNISYSGVASGVLHQTRVRNHLNDLLQ